MTQQALPIATVHQDLAPAGWTLVGDTPAHAVLDDGVDTPDDGTTQCWKRNGSPLNDFTGKRARVEVLLGAVDDPGVVTGHVLRVRFNILRFQWPAGLLAVGRIGLWQGDALVDANKVVEKDLPDPTTTSSWFTWAYPLTQNQAAKITDYADLHVEVQAPSTEEASIMRVTAVDLLVPEAGGVLIVEDGDLALQVAEQRTAPLAVNRELDLPTALWRDRDVAVAVNREAEVGTALWEERAQLLQQHRVEDLGVQLLEEHPLDLALNQVQDTATQLWEERRADVALWREADLQFPLEQKDTGA